jgi:hypothetical protein
MKATTTYAACLFPLWAYRAIPRVKNDQNNSMDAQDVMNNRRRPSFSHSNPAMIAQMKLKMLRKPVIKSCGWAFVTEIHKHENMIAGGNR